MQPIREGNHTFKARNVGKNYATRAHPWLLSKREWDVVEATCHGAETYADAAMALGIATKTVQTHLHNVYAKLGITGRVALITRVLNAPAARERCFPHLRITERHGAITERQRNDSK